MTRHRLWQDQRCGAGDHDSSGCGRPAPGTLLITDHMVQLAQAPKAAAACCWACGLAALQAAWRQTAQQTMPGAAWLHAPGASCSGQHGTTCFANKLPVYSAATLLQGGPCCASGAQLVCVLPCVDASSMHGCSQLAFERL